MDATEIARTYSNLTDAQVRKEAARIAFAVAEWGAYVAAYEQLPDIAHDSEREARARTIAFQSDGYRAARDAWLEAIRRYGEAEAAANLAALVAGKEPRQCVLNLAFGAKGE